MYLPDVKYKAQRIINTRSFSVNNNSGKKMTCVVEFSGNYSQEEIQKELKLLPFSLDPIAFNFEPNSYVVNDLKTKEIVGKVKEKLAEIGFYLNGRFAEWEYYNMDKCIERSMEVIGAIKNN